MEYVLVNDSCILIDLQKWNLLQEFVKLPYRFMIVDILLKNELHSLSDNDKKLISKNFSVQSLIGEERGKS